MHTLDFKHSQNFEFLNLHNIAYNWNQNETLVDGKHTNRKIQNSCESGSKDPAFKHSGEWWASRPEKNLNSVEACAYMYSTQNSVLGIFFFVVLGILCSTLKNMNFWY